jgi:protein-S-isoprenylcysteine O-methyltransferase Ste14
VTQRTDWIEFVPVWDDVADAPEITIEILDPEPASISRGARSFRILSMIVALIGLTVGVLIAVIGIADGSVSLPGGDELPSDLLVGVGTGLAVVEAIVFILAWRQVRSA